MRPRYIPPDTAQYIQYYRNQVGAGLPYFSGSVYQRGGGLGSFFSSIFKGIAPLFSKIPSWVKSGAKMVGKQAFKTGLSMAGDAAAAGDEVEWKQMAKKRLREGGSEFLEEAGKRLRQSGSGKRRRRRVVSIKGGGKRRRKPSLRTKQDIFD